MIELVNARFVPVWINIRTTAVPDVPALTGVVLQKSKLDEQRHVEGGWSRGFYIRSLVLAPDGRTLLNPQGAYFGGGHFPYAQVKATDYVKMLSISLDRLRQMQEASSAAAAASSESR